jgi:hypothetical protein
MTTPQTQTDTSPTSSLRERIQDVSGDAPAWKDSPFRDELLALAQVRDELRLQIHLGKLEAVDKLEEAETRWTELQREIRAGTGPMSQGVKTLVDKIQSTYDELVH